MNKLIVSYTLVDKNNQPLSGIYIFGDKVLVPIPADGAIVEKIVSGDGKHHKAKVTEVRIDHPNQLVSQVDVTMQLIED